MSDRAAKQARRKKRKQKQQSQDLADAQLRAFVQSVGDAAAQGDPEAIEFLQTAAALMTEMESRSFRPDMLEAVPAVEACTSRGTGSPATPEGGATRTALRRS